MKRLLITLTDADTGETLACPLTAEFLAGLPATQAAWDALAPAPPPAHASPSVIRIALVDHQGGPQHHLATLHAPDGGTFEVGVDEVGNAHDLAEALALAVNRSGGTEPPKFSAVPNAVERGTVVVTCLDNGPVTPAEPGPDSAPGNTLETEQGG